MFAQRKCPICSGQEVTVIDSLAFTTPLEYAGEKAVSLVECDSCGFVYKDVVKDLPIETEQAQGENRYESFEQDFTREYLREEANVILSHFGTEADILDVGCCTGYLLYYLGTLGIRSCRGLEPSAVSCKKASQKGISVLNGNVYDNIPEFENRFDVIVLSQVLEHICDLRLCISQLDRWLRKDGFIFISVPDEQHCHEYYGSLSSVLSLEHVNHFGEISLDNLMLGSGYRLLSHEQRNYSADIRHKEERSCIMASFDSVYQKRSNLVDRTYVFQKDWMVGKSIRNLLGQYRAKKASVRKKAEELRDSGKRYIIWGVSHMAMNLLLDELNHVNVVGFTDSDPSKYRLHIMDLPVMEPLQIPEDNTVILVMDSNSKISICQSIKKYGLKNPVLIL